MAFEDFEVVFTDKNAKPIKLKDLGFRQGATFLLTNTGTSQLRVGGSRVSGGPTPKGWPWLPGVTLPITVNGSDTMHVAAEDPATAHIDGLGQDS